MEEVGTHSTVLEEIELSLNTISGENGVTTMRFFGEYGKQKLHILLDSGSYLSFLQEDMANKLGCSMEPATPQLIKVANGQRMMSTQRANGFTWVMQGKVFSYSVRLLPMEGCHLIL